MLNISVNLETGLAKPSQSAVIKAGGGVPVTITFSTNPGSNPVIELALSPQSSTPAVKAFLDVFNAQSSTVYTGVLDANDTRLIAHLVGKMAQTLDCEVVVTVDGAERQPFPNFPVSVQPPILTGPESTEGGPVYLTQTLGDARYLNATENLADLNNAGTARTNLGVDETLFRDAVALPAGLNADSPNFATAGAAGQHTYDPVRFRIWVYVDGQWRYSTLISSAA